MSLYIPCLESRIFNFFKIWHIWIFVSYSLIQKRFHKNLNKDFIKILLFSISIGNNFKTLNYMGNWEQFTVH